MLQVLPDFLNRNCDGDIVLQGHRIGLEHVVWRYHEGDSPEMLACRYPTLPLALVHHVIAFYLENRTEVDAYVAQCENELEQHAAVGHRIDITTLRARLQALCEPAIAGS